MISLLIFTTFLGSFCLYNTSKKVVLSQKFAFENWLQTNPKTAKTLGIILYIISFIIATQIFNLTTGILYCFLLICVILSLIILLRPLIK